MVGASREGTLEEFRLLFPEFSDVSDAAIQVYLDLYNTTLDSANWGTLKGLGVLYASAHQIALSQKRQANAQRTPDDSFTIVTDEPGPIKSAKTQDIEADYQVATSAEKGNESSSAWSTTYYGRTYLDYRNAVVPKGVTSSRRGYYNAAYYY